MDSTVSLLPIYYYTYEHLNPYHVCMCYNLHTLCFKKKYPSCSLGIDSNTMCTHVNNSNLVLVDISWYTFVTSLGSMLWRSRRERGIHPTARSRSTPTDPAGRRHGQSCVTRSQGIGHEKLNITKRRERERQTERTYSPHGVLHCFFPSTPSKRTQHAHDVCYTYHTCYCRPFTK